MNPEEEEQKLNKLQDSNVNNTAGSGQNLDSKEKKSSLNEDELIDAEFNARFASIMKEMNKSENIMKDLDKMSDYIQILLDHLPENPGAAANKLTEPDPMTELISKFVTTEYINKENLYQPLKEAKDQYDQYFEENKENQDQLLFDRFKKQYNCVESLIKELESENPSTTKLCELMTNMQTYGLPPKNVINPLENLNNDLLSDIVSDSLPKSGISNKNPEECNIFQSTKYYNCT